MKKIKQKENQKDTLSNSFIYSSTNVCKYAHLLKSNEHTDWYEYFLICSKWREKSKRKSCDFEFRILIKLISINQQQSCSEYELVGLGDGAPNQNQSRYGIWQGLNTKIQANESNPKINEPQNLIKDNSAMTEVIGNVNSKWN